MKFINEKIASRTSIHTAGTDPPVARPPQGIRVNYPIYYQSSYVCGFVTQVKRQGLGVTFVLNSHHL